MTEAFTTRRQARVQEWLGGRGLDALFLNYGPMFQYATGLERPIMYEVGRQDGDWITGLVLPREGAPTLVLRPSWLREHAEGLPFEVRVLGEHDDPDDFLARQVRALGLDGATIGVPKMLWAQTLTSLQAALPNARWIALSDRDVDTVRSIKDPDELE